MDNAKRLEGYIVVTSTSSRGVTSASVPMVFSEAEALGARLREANPNSVRIDIEEVFTDGSHDFLKKVG